MHGTFTDEQFEIFKKKLHSKIHWLLIYKEADDCEFFDEYFIRVMKYCRGLNETLDHNPMIIDLVTILQVAYDEAHQEPFDFKEYRRYILEAHNIIDRL